MTAADVVDREAAPPPFFVVGAQRSGTTLLRLMLNAHRELAVPFESDFIPKFHRRLDEYGPLSDRSNREKLLGDIMENPFVKKGELIPDPQEILDHEAGDYAELVDLIFTEYARERGKKRWGDKTPTYVEHIDVLRSLFPRCRIIHLVRDGRDVALSLRRVSWGSDHLLRAAEDWRWKTVLGDKMGRCLLDDYLLIRYEELVMSPVEILRKVCAFLDEPYDPDMLSWHEDAEVRFPEESRQWHESALSPIDPSKAFAWKREMSASDRLLFERVASDALRRFGYEVTDRGLDLRSRLKLAWYTFGKRW